MRRTQPLDVIEQLFNRKPAGLRAGRRFFAAQIPAGQRYSPQTEAKKMRAIRLNSLSSRLTQPTGANESGAILRMQKTSNGARSGNPRYDVRYVPKPHWATL